MRFARAFFEILFSVLCVLAFAMAAHAQNAGNSTSVGGTVTDPSGAVIPGATVTIHNPVSQYQRSTTTDASGNFSFQNVPFNPYHMTVTSTGFAPYAQDVDVRSSVPVSVMISLQLAGTTTTVTVEAGGDLIENDPTAHTDIDRQLFDKLPLESQSSSVSSLVTLASPGVAADSNGLFHGLGDHAENSFSVDGQPITDQQSKVFSNQIPVDSIQSLEVIEGAPPAEYGDKTSLVIDVITRSGLGETTPHGSVVGSYGSFGSDNLGADFEYGGQKWGNFISVSGLNTGRFLDPPEFVVMHDKGNQENFFDRVDFQLNTADSLHMNLGFTRSWFQTPNSFDAQDATAWNGVVVPSGGFGPNGLVVGPADERSQIRTYNLSPTWTHLMGSHTVFTTGVFVRHDEYNYYPSSNPFSDLGPPSLGRETVSQLRTLTNAGARGGFSYVRGINNLKAGVTYEQTFLLEHDRLGIIDPTLNAPCITPDTNPLTSAYDPFIPVTANGLGVGSNAINDPSLCAGHGFQPNIASNPNAPCNVMAFVGACNQYPLFTPLLGCYDLTRTAPLPVSDGCPAAQATSGLFFFPGHTDIKELSLYVEDNVTWKNWSINLGIRGDVYNGLSRAQQAEPRLGVAYNIKQSSTVLRVSYARTLETPFNENLLLSSVGCASPVLNPLLSCSSSSLTPIQSGFRNEFHAGLQQAFGKYLVFDGEYIWKYTHNAYDFSVLGNTPITFPIEWARSKIPGFTARINLTNLHGLTAYTVMSSVAARFFLPQEAGAGATPSAPSGVFRIDHDEKFNQTTHLQYQPWKRGPWLGFNWRYDSGLVAGATPCFGLNPSNTCPGSVILGSVPNVSMVVSNVGSVPLSADQEFEAGFTCNGVRATPTTPLPFNCPASEFGSTLLSVPAPGKEDDDHNPPRVQQRNVFDLAIGDDNMFSLRNDRYRISAQVSVINLADRYAPYNFLSTFSGTHYVTPRTVTGEIGFHF